MELRDAMRTTGTCRFFRPDPVPDEVLRAAFDAARFAPQGGNRQPVRWIVVREAATRRRLAELYLPEWERYLGSRTPPPDADRFARTLADVPVIVVVCAELAALHPTDDELGRLSVVGGGSIYPTVQNLCLALREQGVGSAFTTLLCRAEPQVRELLAVPDAYITAAHVAVGYGAAVPHGAAPTTGHRDRLRRGVRPARLQLTAAVGRLRVVGEPEDVAPRVGHLHGAPGRHVERRPDRHPGSDQRGRCHVGVADLQPDLRRTGGRGRRRQGRVLAQQQAGGFGTDPQQGDRRVRDPEGHWQPERCGVVREGDLEIADGQQDVVDAGDGLCDR